MSNTRGLIVLFAITCLSLALLYSMGQSTVAQFPENQPLPSSEAPGSLLVVPESPLGTLGLMGALALAFGVFIVRKKSF